MRAIAWGRRVARSAWADPLLALALLALGEYEVWSGATYDGGPVFPGPRIVTALAVVPVLTLPLARRRRRPLVALALNMGTMAWSALAFGGIEATTGFVSGMIAVYSAAANSSRALLSLVAAAAAIAINDVRDPHIHGGGDVAWAIGMAGIAWLFGIAVRGRYVRIGALEDETARLAAERDEQARAAVAEERGRVARELHDIVAHAVSVVVVQAQAGQRLVGVDDSRARQSLEAIEDTARTALNEMRRLLGMLREVDAAALEPQPGLAQVDALVAQVREAGLPVAVEREGEPVPLSPGIDLSAYRVVQEGLTNALKHAGASGVRVRVRYQADGVEVEVEDDGTGGSAADGDGGGHGLLGIRERIELYGGAMHSGRRPEGGWLLKARLPLRA